MNATAPRSLLAGGTRRAPGVRTRPAGPGRILAAPNRVGKPRQSQTQMALCHFWAGGGDTPELFHILSEGLEQGVERGMEQGTERCGVSLIHCNPNPLSWFWHLAIWTCRLVFL